MTRTLLWAGAVCLLVCASPVSGDPIHRAVEAGDLAEVQRILQEDPSAVSRRDQNEFHELPLHFAARSGNIEIARVLLDAGTDIDAGDSDNSTALGIAAMMRQGEMVDFLIQQGANVNHRDRKADCPLSFAVSGADEAIIQRLVDVGADLYFRNLSGESLLHLACARGLTGFVKHLLENSADLEVKSGNGGTPLGYAAMSGQIEIVRLLLENGADPSPGRQGDMTPLLMSIWRNQVEAARLLLERGAEVDRGDLHGSTALLNAAESGSTEMLQLLLDHGAAVNHRNQNGETALIKAATGGHADRVAILLAAGADPNLGTDPGGRNGLQLAAIGGHLETARQLLAGGANPHATTPTGETALQLGRYYGHADVSALLRDGGGESGGPASADRSLATLGRVGKKEAVIWFLGHSGWGVKTQGHLLVFDYFPQGEPPAFPGLCNGNINPSEIAAQKVAVFASHHHRDHFDPLIFEWREQVADISYFIGLEPENAPPYVTMSPRTQESHDDLKLTTIRSTDAGVGMVVEVDGLTIFHAGDHANGRIGLMTEFTDEIDFLADQGIRPDICFMGIRGCSLGSPEQVKEGVHHVLKTLGPRAFIPMHAAAQGHLYREFIEECRKQFPAVEMAAPDNRGDHFVYSKGKLTDPKRDETRHARLDRSDRQALADPRAGESD